MCKKILGLDLGSNSIGWALVDEKDKKTQKIIGLGTRIFPRAVEDKTPTPKNMNRRLKRLARRVLRRRAKRKQRMMDYLVTLDLLPASLKGHGQPEIVLNQLGDPYPLRADALDKALDKHQLGRVFLHLVQRRGFLSNRKTLLGDMADDPDVIAILEQEGDDVSVTGPEAKEENAFKADIADLWARIKASGSRTLGEYLARQDAYPVKRNRAREGGKLRTDRQMYQEEFTAIFDKQAQYHALLTEEVRAELEHIIFFQRPLKLNPDRVGRCGLEKRHKRCRMARLDYQRFRYLQDINHLQYFDDYQEKECSLDDAQKEKLIELFEQNKHVTFPKIRKALGFDKKTSFNLERAGNKKLKGNTTACEIREIVVDWDAYSDEKQEALVEDMLTIRKKSVLKSRLMDHWGFSVGIAVRLCMLEFEPGYGNYSRKAIRRLLPFLQQGQIFSDARQSAGYGYEREKNEPLDRLPAPPVIPNPIVQKALHELRRVTNAIIAEYGKPDEIRIEMARDLEMNTKRYKEFAKRQQKNTKDNEEAVEKFQEIGATSPHLGLKYPSRDDKIKYRLWKDQDGRCVYSGDEIPLTTLFSAEIDIDHIIPYSQSLDDSYMNKVVCYAGENREKGQRTPIDAFGDSEQWVQITARIARWDKGLESKRKRFYMTDADVIERDFINNQLNDTRYISRVALEYVAALGCEVSVVKGIITAWLRHQWGFDRLLGRTQEKERTDHRHHLVDALVVACVGRGFYQKLARTAREHEQENPELKLRNLVVDPPWPSICQDLEAALQDMLVSHVPMRKLAGALHEETGVGYIEGVGPVYRKNLDRDFKASWVSNIIDEGVKAIVTGHLEDFGNDPKKAFSQENMPVYHKNGKTPIKRVRVVQSQTTREKLEASKYGVRNRAGEVFKWLAYGNYHHVEIVKNCQTRKYEGVFVTMHEAARRARGIHSNKQPIICTDHGDDWRFVMALHINDTVSLLMDGKRQYYRVQKLDGGNNVIMLRLHTAATLKDKTEEILKAISRLMAMDMTLHRVNAIGKIMH